MLIKTDLLISALIVAMLASVVVEALAEESSEVPITIISWRSSTGDYWHIIHGLRISSKPISYPVTLHIPFQCKRHAWINKGRFVEYIGSEKWKWTISEVAESEIRINGNPTPSLAVKLSFEPYRPETSSIIASRKSKTHLTFTGNDWWFPLPYVPLESLDQFRNGETEKIHTSLGIVECYKFKLQQGKSSVPHPGGIGFIGKADGFVWYDVNTGILVRENIKTDKGELLKSGINKTNIKGLAIISD